MEQLPTQCFFIVQASAKDKEILRHFFLKNGMLECFSVSDADVIVHDRFEHEYFLSHQFWIVLKEDIEDKHEGLFYAPMPEDPKLVERLLRQIKRSYQVWFKYQQTKEHLVVPKTYLEIFSQQIQVQLKGMSGLSTILKEGYLSDLQREKYADYISGNANRLQNFFANLWEYYQYRHHQRSLKVQNINLKDLLQELHERFQRILNSQEKDDTVEFHLKIGEGIGNEELELKTDKRRFLIIISNLLDNAVNFTKVGKIIWQASINDNMLEVKVENEDLSEQNLEDEKQLGIGLLVGHYNAEIIHGKLNVKHKENETCAVLSLPLTVNTTI